jgi:hypothetical protein
MKSGNSQAIFLAHGARNKNVRSIRACNDGESIMLTAAWTSSVFL